jgi:uncharacterized protein YdhG (YjbR/CyaY superfamily)
MAVAKSVEDYLAGLPEEPRAALQRLRDTIRSAAPGSSETISYQIPTVKLHGRALVAYAAFKDHCSLFPMSMRVIDAHALELKPYRASKGTLHFDPARPIPAALVKKLVKARIDENAERGR